MVRKVLAALSATAIAGAIVASVQAAGASSGRSSPSSYEPVLAPSNFVSVIDNPYYPLPVGRVLVYRGVKDGVTQRETVTVTNQTRVLEGITARAISDVSKHQGTLLEKTTDWYAQDAQGNVWYMGEATAAYNPNGTVDTSGSWLSGVHDGEPGIIMEAHPQVPDAYRQEFLAGQAQDTAWIVDTAGSITVPYGRLRRVLTSLEATQVEPGAYDRKVYAPGIGIAFEEALTGGPEFSKLVSVTG